jgi:hypothetical protein
LREKEQKHTWLVVYGDVDEKEQNSKFELFAINFQNFKKSRRAEPKRNDFDSSATQLVPPRTSIELLQSITI